MSEPEFIMPDPDAVREMVARTDALLADARANAMREALAAMGPPKSATEAAREAAVCDYYRDLLRGRT